ncbi:MAG: HlyD family secretion protein [Acetobacteraceae bacterium]|nr:HlyD family secretion protein [Acetobacteraceae bacterium]
MPDDDEADDARRSYERPRGDADHRSKTQDRKASSDDEDDDEDDGGEGDDEKGGKKKNGSKLPLIILGIVVLIAAIGGAIWWFLHRNQIDTDDAYTDGRVVMVASQVNGYVTVLGVNDNQFVHKGDLLVQIDPRPYEAARDQAKGELAAAEAQLNSARVALQKAKTTFPAQLAQAQGQLTQAQGTLYNAQTDYKRQHAVSRGATTQQSVDQSTASLKSAQGQVQVAQAQVEMANLIPQDIEQAEAQVRQLEGQVLQMRGKLATAEVNLGFTRVTAPQDGWVTRRNVEQGNFLQPGMQIMALVTPDTWVTANFKENQLTRMRRGQDVDIEVDAYPDLKLKGHIDSIQLGSGSKFSAFPAENATGNFVKIVQRVPVKIVIDSGIDPDRPLPLGISVVPTVYVK